MRIGNIEAKPGEYVFDYLKVAKSRSGLSPDIPIHLFVGAEPGPTLLIQAAIHGAEIIGTIAILNFIQKLDPKAIRGTVIAVPVVDRVGFELAERGSRIDKKDISRLFPGNPIGSVSDQVAAIYFEEVIRKAGGRLLKDVVLFDVYMGDPIPQGKKSLTYALTYQDAETTLTDKNAAKVRKKIIGAATHRLKAELRS